MSWFSEKVLKNPFINPVGAVIDAKQHGASWGSAFIGASNPFSAYVVQKQSHKTSKEMEDAMAKAQAMIDKANKRANQSEQQAMQSQMGASSDILSASNSPKGSNVGKIIGGVLILGVLATGGYFLFRGKKNKK